MTTVLSSAELAAILRDACCARSSMRPYPRQHNVHEVEFVEQVIRLALNFRKVYATDTDDDLCDIVQLTFNDSAVRDYGDTEHRAR